MSFKQVFKQKIKQDIKNTQIISEKNEKTQDSKDPEEILRKNNFKIKKKYGTKFGTEFVMAKEYPHEDIKKALKGFKLIFDENSVFVQY